MLLGLKCVAALAEVIPQPPEEDDEARLIKDVDIVGGGAGGSLGEDGPVAAIPAASNPAASNSSSSVPAMAQKGSFSHGFVATLSVILVSELGDKTFFIAAIMAMRHPRWVVLGGAMTALIIMHVMSACFGVIAMKLVPKVYTFYISSVLFVLFGLKMLWEAWRMKPEAAHEEIEEVQMELRQLEATDAADRRRSGSLEAGAASAGAAPASAGDACRSCMQRLREVALTVFSSVFVQAFTMTFLAEWGDRSQMATIILATTENIWSVIIGGVLGHAVCTGLAVLGGRIIASKISVRLVTFIGGVVFLIFAVTAFIMGPGEDEDPAAAAGTGEAAASG